jgi:riboflavin biosynthesis pyrimidine reductase
MLRHLETGDRVDVLEMLFAEKREPRDGKPWVMLNIVESIDGATAIDGSATGLNDADDRKLFLALRAVTDVVMNGAATVRAENLGPVRLSEDMKRRRLEAGMQGPPTMVVLSRSLSLDPGLRIFSDPERRPMVITDIDADPDRLEALGDVAEIVQIEELDGAGIIDALEDVSVILCEGGPTINSQLIESGFVDEVNLTISPVLALGDSKRVASGPAVHTPTAMRLDRTLLGDRSLFLRFVRDRGE